MDIAEESLEVGVGRPTEQPEVGESTEGPILIAEGPLLDAPKVRKGTPKKADLAAKSPGGRRQVGRPKGDQAIMNEFKARMLNSPKSRKVLDAVFSAALDDNHKYQAAAWKMIVDRVIPMDLFTQDIKRARASNGIQITISGVPNINIGGGEVPDDNPEQGDCGDEDRILEGEAVEIYEDDSGPDNLCL